METRYISSLQIYQLMDINVVRSFTNYHSAFTINGRTFHVCTPYWNYLPTLRIEEERARGGMEIEVLISPRIFYS